MLRTTTDCRSTTVALCIRSSESVRIIPAGGGVDSTLGKMAVVRLFAAARQAAGTGRDELPGHTVDAVLRAAQERYGPEFVDVLPTCRIWVNGESADQHDEVGSSDEVAVLPPVSGGSW